MKISLFAHARDAVPNCVDVSWEDFCESLQHQAAYTQDKRDLRAWSPATYREGTRSNTAVERVSCAVLDLDSVTEEQFADCLSRTAGVARVVYSTFSHGTKAGIRARLVARLTRPIEPAEWQSWLAAWEQHTGGLHDPHARDISRIYFGAYHPPEHAHEAFSVHLPGVPLDVDALLKERKDSLLRVDRQLVEIVAKRIARASPGIARFAVPLEQLAAGEPFAAPGERDSTIFRMLHILHRECPDADPQTVVDIFAPSLAVMASLNPETPTLDTVAEKVRRIWGDEGEGKSTANASRISEAFGGTRSHPYGPEELATLAESVGCSLAELSTRWVVQKDRAYYLLQTGGGYKGPFTAAEVVGAAATWLAASPVVLHTTSPTGAKTPKPAGQLVDEHGTVADAIVLDMVAEKTTYDATARTVYEVSATPRSLAAVYDPEVDRWLDIFGGRLAHTLKSWIAAVLSVNVPCTALLLTGAKSAGKSLLGHGLARLWTTGAPTALRNAAGKWGDALHRCPLVIADERIPEGITTEDIREFIQARQRPIDRKFLPTATLRGAARLIISANNASVLALDEELTENDLAAIAERFVHIDVDHSPGEYLRSLPCGGASFVQQDRLAKHARWLAKHHPWEPSGRFLVSTNDDRLFRSLLNTTGTRASVLHWTAAWLCAPERVPPNGAHVAGCYAWVKAAAIVASWSSYLSIKQPPAQRIARALRSVTDDSQHGGLRRISTTALRAWAEETEVIEWSTIATKLGIKP